MVSFVLVLQSVSQTDGAALPPCRGTLRHCLYGGPAGHTALLWCTPR
jgi:hypothetical protein